MPEREAEDNVVRTPLPYPILIHTQHYLSTSSSIDIEFPMALTQYESGQIVFQISVPLTQEAPYHARRPHNKSRTGCLACKKRHVKCDETRPGCQRCQKRAIPCSYAPDRKPDRSNALASATSINQWTGVAFSLSLKDMESMVLQALETDMKWSSSPLERTRNARSLSLVAFQHFVNYSTETVGHPSLRRVLNTDMIRVAFASPYLMYTVLAVGILHLNRVSPGNERCSLVESYLWQQAIHRYQAALCSSVTRENVDALLSTCILMGVMSLCPERFSPTDSWVLTNRPEDMNWLCLQSGLRCITSLAGPSLSGSIWAPAFKDTHKEEFQIYSNQVQQGRAGLDTELADLCEIDDCTTKETSPYHSPLRVLAVIMKLEKSARAADQCKMWVGRLEPNFLALLRQRDPPALLIVAHWMGLMCHFSQWKPWVECRIRSECVAICMYLETSTDPRVLRLLRFPADACGYPMLAS
ncbi:putative C6 transcription factor [Aspergillus campestris IBT 28561]|uniref:C6 transcription factor n=1 Tax=Aspergillus campestris (strain IBT 28561) TaxID=1392248 RepID=A0A2I1D0Q6_ASPC2|nr:putative C6 transcription factor [Aspergillus campestris IBT 28561]PKY03461.1 putative C6 transcription factor [Aspergillus campestris IBT 28561]